MIETVAATLKPSVAMGEQIQEYRLAARVTLQDAVQEIGWTLVSLDCTFEHHEAHGAVIYQFHQDSRQLGRVVVVPPTRVFSCVRVREIHHSPESNLLCQAIRRNLEALSEAAEEMADREDARYSYPRCRRRTIVEEYRTARRNGEVENKETWAQRYHITRKTLWRYECEFPEP